MNFDLVGIFFTVVLAHFLALLSPGPDFILVVKSAFKGNRKNAIGVALGIAIANAVYIGLCLIGVGVILASSIYLMVLLKIVGGLFLIYLGFNALKVSKDRYKNLDMISSDKYEFSKSDFIKEFITGFMSGILNPKNLLFYLSLFTVVLNPEIGISFKLILAIWMTMIVFIWDVSIIYLLSKQQVRKKFTKMAFYIDKVTGVILGVIGFNIVKSVLVKQ